jgi:hypothetical protein
MSETSTPYTPASTSTNVAINETVSLANEIKKYKTKELIEFLRKEENLELEEEDLEIIRKQRVNGRDFFKITEEKLEKWGMSGGPATRLADFARECKEKRVEKRLRAFSSYKTKKDLNQVLYKYGVEDGRITDIRQFSPSKGFFAYF